MSQISRLTTFSNGSIIDAIIHNQEHDLFTNTCNSLDTRTTALESGNLTISGNKTFNGTVSLASTLSVTGAATLSNNLSIAGTLAVTGTSTLTGYVTLGQTTPTLDAHAASKIYVDNKFGAGLLGFNQTTAPVYSNSTQFTVQQISCRNSANTDTISKSTATTVDVSTVGLNGCAQSGTSLLLGTVATTSGSTTVSGTNTSFLTDFQVGDVISVSGAQDRRISSIASNTSLTVESNFVTTISGAAYFRGGRAPNTFYNLYAISDTVSNTGLVLSTRNTSAGDSMVDLPGSVSTVSTVDATADTITTSSNHNLRAGLAFQFKDSGSGSLPTGLTFNTTYYASIVSSTVFKVHTTQADAVAGVNNINFTGSKSGTVIITYTSYTNVRQLAFCIRTNADTTTPTIIAFYIVDGWPSRPLIIYNTVYDEVTFSNTTTGILTAGVSTSFADVSTSTWIPAISRVGLFWFWASNNVRINLRAKGSPSSTGIPTSLSSQNISQERIMDIDSNRIIQYQNSSGVSGVNIAVRGFIISEVY